MSVLRRLFEELYGASKAYTAIDMGSGRGGSLRFLSGYSVRTIALDIDINALMENYRVNKRYDRLFICCDAMQTPIKDHSIDLIFMSGFLHEVDADKVPFVLGECLRILRKGGSVIVVDLAAVRDMSESERLVIEDEMMLQRLEYILGLREGMGLGIRPIDEILRIFRYVGFSVKYWTHVKDGDTIPYREFIRRWGGRSKRLLRRLKPDARILFEDMIMDFLSRVERHGYGLKHYYIIIAVKGGH